VRDRMRSTSRNRINKSPPMDNTFTPSPYESVLPATTFPVRRDSFARTKSPADELPPPLPTTSPVAAYEGLDRREATPSSFYRTPKEIRANMPPEQLQMGVYNPNEGFL